MRISPPPRLQGALAAQMRRVPSEEVYSIDSGSNGAKRVWELIWPQFECMPNLECQPSVGIPDL